MVPPLSTAAAAGLIASATSQRRAADRLRRLARAPGTSEDELRRALEHAATKLEAHAYLTEVAAELCGSASGHRE